jgi:DNA mismatch endonuclease, patch repair protein
MSRATQYPSPTSAAVSAAMRGNRKRDTRPEVQVRSLLHRRGYRFRKNLPINVGGWQVRADIVFTRQRLAVFIDGCFWHRCPIHGTSPRANTWYWGPKLDRNVERDRETDQRLRSVGWTVLRMWEHEAPELVVSDIAKVLSSLSGLAPV